MKDERPQAMNVRFVGQAPGRWRWWAWGALAVLVVMGVVGAWAAWLSRQAPGAWVQERQRLATQPAETLEAQAVELEQRVLAALQPAGGRSELTITQREANAWLHTRLRPWLEHFGLDAGQWCQPESGAPVVRMGQKEVTVHWGIGGGGSGRIASATLVFQRRGAAEVLRLSRVKVGRMTLPGLGWLLRQAPGRHQAGLRTAAALLDGRRIDGLVINDGQWTGGRPVRLADVRVQEGRLTAVFEAEAR